MKHNIIPKALRCLAVAGLCLAAAACSKDDIAPESAPQQGITPTRIIFNVTRGGYDGDAETRAPKNEWAEGDVVYFYKRHSKTPNKATLKNGVWVFDFKDSFSEQSVALDAHFAEHYRQSSISPYYFTNMGNGDVAYTTEGRYEADENGEATITLRLDRHPQGRMTFTGLKPGEKLVVQNMQDVQYWQTIWFPNPEEIFVFNNPAPITLTAGEDGTATLYGLPAPATVSEEGITLTVKYDGLTYAKKFIGKEFKPGSNIFLEVPDLEDGWYEPGVSVYGPSDLKLGDYLYSDGTTSDGGLRKIYHPYDIVVSDSIPPLEGKTVVGLVFYPGRHESDNSDYSKPFKEGNPTLVGEVRGYAVAVTDAHNGDDDREMWMLEPWTLVGTSHDNKAWNGFENCRDIHNFVISNYEGWTTSHFKALLIAEEYGKRYPPEKYGWQSIFQAPEGTSGWFLPSCGQLEYIMFYERFLDKQLLKVQEHTTDPEAKSHITPFPQIRSYWSSTEAHKVGAWGVDAKVAKDPFYKDQKLYTRSILAF